MSISSCQVIEKKWLNEKGTVSAQQSVYCMPKKTQIGRSFDNSVQNPLSSSGSLCTPPPAALPAGAPLDPSQYASASLAGFNIQYKEQWGGVGPPLESLEGIFFLLGGLAPPFRFTKASLLVQFVR